VTHDNVPLLAVPRILHQDYGLTVSYAALWRRAVGDLIPTHRNGSRWRVRTRDIPVVAAVFQPARASSKREG
jgi:hypothetical protein